MSIAQDLLTQVEAAITALITGAEEMQINGRKYRKTDLDQLRVMRKDLQEEVFYEQLSVGGATRAYAAWPFRRGGTRP